MPKANSPKSAAFSITDLIALQAEASPTTKISPTSATPPPSPVSSTTPDESTVPETTMTTPEPPRTSIKSLAVRRPALDEFERAVGGRDVLVETLEMATLGERETHLLALLCDPKRSKDTLTTIARDSGLKVQQILDLFRSSSFAKAHALSLVTAAAALPSVVGDIAAKSVDAKVECPTCFGSKEVEKGVKCPTCWGKGEIFRTSDLDRQKTLLEVAGMTKKSGGLQVQVNTQVNNNTVPTSYFSRWVKDSDSAAYNIIDAEVKPTDGSE